MARLYKAYSYRRHVVAEGIKTRLCYDQTRLYELYNYITGDVCGGSMNEHTPMVRHGTTLSTI